MAEPFDTIGASFADVIDRLAKGEITGAQAATALSPLLAATNDGEFAARVEEIVGVIGRVTGILFVEVPEGQDRPSNLIGAPESYAWDRGRKTFWGPKDKVTGWPEGDVMTEGPPGPAIELQKSPTHVQWRVVGAPDWADLIALADLKGADGSDGSDGANGTDGQEVGLQATVTHVQWRLGAGAWVNLIALSLLQGADGADGADGSNGADGADGREVEIQTNATHIQWRYTGEAGWTDLIARALLKGDRGDAFAVNAQGDLTGRAAYDGEMVGFSYLDVENGNLYFRIAPSGWSTPIPFGKGDKGDDGAPGADGASAYAVAVANGFVGTQAAWLASLVGAKGDDGDQGVPGVDGADGANGSDATVTEAAVLDALGFTPEDASKKGAASGYAGLDAGGKVPAEQLPAMGAVESVAGLTGEISAWDLNGALGVRSDFGQQAISLARLIGQVQGMARGVADDFQDVSGVDAAASTGEQYSAVSKSYAGVPGVALPLMTAPNAPAGHEATASSSGGSLPPWKAFDGLDNTIWIASSAALPQWLRRKLPTAGVISSYAIIGTPSWNPPTTWTVRGSNDGSTWTTIDTRSGVTWVSDKQVQTFMVQNPGSYIYYELLMTAATSAAALQMIEWTMTTAPEAMSLRSIAFAATAAPSRAMLTVRAKGASALTPGTDISGHVSRDGGATWTTASLIAGITVGGFTTFEASNIVLSAQPTGLVMKWRVDVAPDRSPEVDAVVLQWSPN